MKRLGVSLLVVVSCKTPQRVDSAPEATVRQVSAPLASNQLDRHSEPRGVSGAPIDAVSLYLPIPPRSTEVRIGDALISRVDPVTDEKAALETISRALDIFVQPPTSASRTTDGWNAPDSLGSRGGMVVEASNPRPQPEAHAYVRVIGGTTYVCGLWNPHVTAVEVGAVDAQCNGLRADHNRLLARVPSHYSGTSVLIDEGEFHELITIGFAEREPPTNAAELVALAHAPERAKLVFANSQGELAFVIEDDDGGRRRKRQFWAWTRRTIGGLDVICQAGVASHETARRVLAICRSLIVR